MKEGEDLVTKEEENPKWVSYECVHCGAKALYKPNLNMFCPHDRGRGKKPISYPLYPTGFALEETPKRIKELVKSPDYFNKLFKESGKRIIGEESGRKALILLLLGGRLVVNAKPTSFNSLLSALVWRW